MGVMRFGTAEIQTLTARLSSSTTITSSIATTPAPEPLAEPTSLLAQHCAKCHGAATATPGGGLFLHADSAIDGRHALKAKRLMESGKMPKGGPPLPAETQAAILKEIESFIPQE